MEETPANADTTGATAGEPAGGHGPRISVSSLVSRFRWKVLATLSLVVAEAAIGLTFPLFLGLAINGLLEGSYHGLAYLGAVGLGALVVGSGRRFFDTRAYSGIYEKVAVEVAGRELGRGGAVSAVAARSTMLSELVEFLENSLPMIVTSAVSLVGVLAVLATLNVKVFFACLALLALVAAVYWLSSGRNFRLNQGYNDELERQVDALASGKDAAIGAHFRGLMRWNVQLSDLETANFLVIWLGVIGLMVYSPIAVVGGGEASYGFAIAILIYVFDYIGSVVALPLFIQQIIRLQEISRRLSATS